MLPARYVLLVLLFACLTAACGSDMAPVTQVANLRVLAIRADPPEVYVPSVEDVGSTSVDALVAGGEGAVVHDWRVCFIPGVVTTGEMCLVPEAEVALGQGLSVTIPLPSPEALLAQAPEEFQGFEVDLSAGLPVQVQLDVMDESGRTLTALKEVLISSREETNTNPELTGLTLDGVPWAEGEVFEVSEPGTALELVPQWVDTTRERYDDQGVEVTESLLFSWFVDDESSEFSKERSSERVPANTLTIEALSDEAPEERLVTLWLVARDDRGGVTWLTRQLRIMRGG